MDNFTFRRGQGLTWVVCEPLERAGFKNAFSTRAGGVSPLPADALSLGNLRQDERERVFENRRRFLAAIGAADWALVTARQIHSAEVCRVGDAGQARREPPACDALAADLARTLLAVQTADCLPILIGDSRTRAFAAVHAGWRGTLARIVARTVERMQHDYDSRPADLCAALGPAIGPCCFEVGPEVVGQFAREFSWAGEIIAARREEGKALLDLNRANLYQLLDCGVGAESVFDSALCTVCRNDLFFSYRRERGAERPVGRLMGVIGKDK
ncbi:MAG TPA: peptidoglycan editing factor PgeF [Blastocatellia bacterium]|nr:peptidoglycan editing factor PgeF [Blastocatellia bacterium]